MKRLAFLAAAALLGTACGSSTSLPPGPAGDVAFYWQFRDFDGNVSGDFGLAAGCGTAGVTDVDVAIWQGASQVVYETVPCQQANDTGAHVAGAAITLPVASYTYSLTAYRGPDPVFYVEGSFAVADGALTRENATLDVGSTTLPLTLYYTLDGNYTCAGIDNIYYRIWTDSTRTTLVANQQVPCDPVAFGFTLPSNENVGTYYVEWFQARTAAPVSLFERCAFTVRHAGFPAAVNLLPAPDASCP